MMKESETQAVNEVRGETPQENEGNLDSEVKTDLEHLICIDSIISTEKKGASFHLFPFFLLKLKIV